jgi:hypothetical protein
MFETKDSGQRAEYASGMVRDTEAGKARFDLLFPLDVPYSAQMLTRFAELMARGAEKYDARNWEKAKGAEELARYRSSALRHLVQWLAGETDEDHAAAVMFNLLAGETVKYKMSNPEPGPAYLAFRRNPDKPLFEACSGEHCCSQCGKGYCCSDFDLEMC